MIEQEIKKQYAIYKDMYYTLWSAIDDALEEASENTIKRILIEAKYRAAEIFLFEDETSITKIECVDMMSRTMNAMLYGVVPMDEKFFDLCVNKALEWQNIELPSKEKIDENIAKLLKKLEENRKLENNE